VRRRVFSKVTECKGDGYGVRKDEDPDAEERRIDAPPPQHPQLERHHGQEARGVFPSGNLSLALRASPGHGSKQCVRKDLGKVMGRPRSCTTGCVMRCIVGGNSELRETGKYVKGVSNIFLILVGAAELGGDVEGSLVASPELSNVE
jgi:hypothetical protein